MSLRSRRLRAFWDRAVAGVWFWFHPKEAEKWRRWDEQAEIQRAEKTLAETEWASPENPVSNLGGFGELARRNGLLEGVDFVYDASPLNGVSFYFQAAPGPLALDRLPDAADIYSSGSDIPTPAAPPLTDTVRDGLRAGLLSTCSNSSCGCHRLREDYVPTLSDEPGNDAMTVTFSGPQVCTLGDPAGHEEPHTYWHLPTEILDGTRYEADDDGQRRRVETLAEANLIGSQRECGCHSPVLDIDFPARLIPSTTPGHFHLYLDGVRMPWEKYKRLLRALAAAGVLEQGYVEASLERGGTFVRKPGVRKPEAFTPDPTPTEPLGAIRNEYPPTCACPGGARIAASHSRGCPLRPVAVECSNPNCLCHLGEPRHGVLDTFDPFDGLGVPVGERACTCPPERSDSVAHRNGCPVGNPPLIEPWGPC